MSSKARLRARMLGTEGHSEAGFTLVEMLVALALLSVALFALLGGFITAANSIQKQQLRSKAIRVALDTNERLRLAAYDGLDLSLGSHAGVGRAPDGTSFNYTYVVAERSAGTGLVGDLIKQITTTVSWTSAGRGSVTYVTAVAADAKDVGLPAGYQQTIRSMVIAPAPSTVVDYNGFTAQDVVITLILTGHTTDDVVHISWTDDRGSLMTVDARSTNAYQWVVNIGQGGAGIHLRVPGGTDPATGKAYSKNLVFTAKTDTGLATASTLPVFGPVLDPPTITAFTVTSNRLLSDVKVFKNGNNQYQNSSDVVVSCSVTRLTSANDIVLLSYYNALGQITQVPLIPTATPVQSAGSTWTKTFASSSTAFYYVPSSPPRSTVSSWSCGVTRISDSGPAVSNVNVSVHT